MAFRRVIFFDVGNTLLFPNRERILAPLPADRHPTLEQWHGFQRQIKNDFDQAMLQGSVDHGFWHGFYSRMLKDLCVEASDGICDALVQNTQNSANWDQILPGTRESLERIRTGYRTAVISNADGRIDAVLRRCGIADCFETITDSGIVGHEKPHPAIFEAALRSMQAQPAESLYVGDVYSVDYVGARNAGMDAVLFDVPGAYRGRGLPRVESMNALEDWLAQ